MFFNLNLLFFFIYLLNEQQRSVSASSSSSLSPNIVLFITDDQDWMVNGMESLIKMKTIFSENSLQFINGFTSTPVCCVSRGSILTGRYVHNHEIINNTETGNCGTGTWLNNTDGGELNTFGTHLYMNGYKTFYSGKYLNRYGTKDAGGLNTIPFGWDTWYTLQGDACFTNCTFSEDGKMEQTLDYYPSLMKDRALEFIEDVYNNDNQLQPFLLTFASPAAHKPWTYEEQYQYIVDDDTLTAPRTKNWNYRINENEDKGVIIRNLGEMNDSIIAQSDLIYRMRHASLLTLDDTIQEIYDLIKEYDMLENTYFIYISDHGFHLGQYGMSFGKRLLYETDIRIPFYIKGPSVRSGTTQYIALTVDVAPTIIDLALGYVPSDMDGNSLKSVLFMSEEEEEEIESSLQMFLVEYHGETSPTTDTDMNKNIMYCESQVDGIDGIASCDCYNNTFTCVRIINGENTNFNSDNDNNNIDSEYGLATKSLNKGEIFCQYTCFDNSKNEAECMEDTIEFKGEYYNLNDDEYQLTNQMDQLTDDQKTYYKNLITAFMSCSGQDECNEQRSSKLWNKQNTIIKDIDYSTFETKKAEEEKEELLEQQRQQKQQQQQQQKPGQQQQGFGKTQQFLKSGQKRTNNNNSYINNNNNLIMIMVFTIISTILLYACYYYYCSKNSKKLLTNLNNNADLTDNTPLLISTKNLSSQRQ